MIIIKSRGELGNQIFQYGAAKKALQEGESLVLVGFHQLCRTFPKLSRKTVTYAYGKKATKRVQKVWQWLENQESLGRLGRLHETRNGVSAHRTRGNIRGVTLAEGFFQDPDTLDWKSLDELVKAFQSTTSPPANSKNLEKGRMTCFVHVRRGDYLSWPSPESPAALPSQWYQAQMRAVTEWAHPNPVDFHVFSDDRELAAQEIGRQPNVLIHDGTVEEDFAAMCSAQAGILSASTFSWWAAYFASRKSSGPFFAPKYWLGFRQQEWQPESLRAEFLTFVDV